jgi:hypothetical protein
LCFIILNDTRFFSASFAVHCCLVWWVPRLVGGGTAIVFYGP